MPKEYALVETLSGNYKLKELDQVKEWESVEMEFYGALADVKAESKKHLDELRKEGLI